MNTRPDREWGGGARSSATRLGSTRTIDFRHGGCSGRLSLGLDLLTSADPIDIYRVADNIDTACLHIGRFRTHNVGPPWVLR